MTNEELIALAALVVGNAAETNAANDSRKQQGYSVAYDGICGADALQALEMELRKRGILK